MKLTEKETTELKRLVALSIWGEIIHIAERDRGNAEVLAGKIVPYIAEFFEREDKFYTPEEVAEMMKLDIQTMVGYIRKGDIRAIRLGKGYRIAKSDIDEFIIRRKT